MLGFRFEFDHSDPCLQHSTLSLESEEPQALDSLRGKIVILRDLGSSRLLRRLFGKKLELSGPILVCARELLDALNSFIHGQNSEFSLYGEDSRLHFLLRGGHVKLSMQPVEASASVFRLRRASFSVPLGEFVDVCIKGVAGLMIGMKNVNPLLEKEREYQALLFRHSQTRQSLQAYREGKTAKSPGGFFMIKVQQIPKGHLAVGALILVLFLQTSSLMRVQRQLGRMKSDLDETHRIAARRSAETTAKSAGKPHSRPPGAPLIGKGSATGKTNATIVPDNGIPGGEVRRSGLLPTGSQLSLPPLPVQVGSLPTPTPGMNPTRVGSQATRYGSKTPISTSGYGNRGAAVVAPPRVCPMKLVGVVAYENEALAVLEDGPDTVFKRAGDIVDLRDLGTWKVVAVLPDRVQLSKIEEKSRSTKTLAQGGGRNAERMALILQK